MKQSFFSLTTLLLLLSILFITNRSEAQDRYVATYSYEPKTREQVANNGICIAFVSPYFDGLNTDALLGEFEDFQKAMESEIEELLIARGFKTRGPFKTRDEMVFQDKKSSDFTLVIAIEWNAKLTRQLKKIFGPGQFKTKKGELSISRAVSLTAISNFTGEKLWKKRLTLSPQTITWAGSKDLGDNAENVGFWEEYKLDPKHLSEPFGKGMEQTFADALDILWKQFNVEEMKKVAEEAKLERSNDRKN